MFRGLWEPVTLVCKYVATSEAPSHFVKMELSVGLARGGAGPSWARGRRGRLFLVFLSLVCFVTNSAPLPFVFFTTLPVNLLVLDTSCEQSHTAHALSCLASLRSVFSRSSARWHMLVLFLADYFLI